MPARVSILIETLRSRLWLIPMLFTIGAAIAAIVTVTIDRGLGPDVDGPFVFGGGPESARSILSTIAAAMLSFTGLVFSVTMLVLQLASSQLSPRVTRTYLRDRNNQVVLGVFVATFVYALLVLREVRSEGPAGFVPSIAVWWAFVLLLASIVAFIYYIDHMAHAMRASTVIASVAAETRDAIDRCYPRRAEPRGDPSPLPPMRAVITGRDEPGVVQAIDVDRLVAMAREAGVVIELLVGVGHPVPGGAAIAVVRGPGDVDERTVRGAITMGQERTMDQDPAFGLRQLVDIATRALSPGVNDPTTARQVVDQLHDLLRRIAVRELPERHHVDRDGVPWLVVPGPTWDDLVGLACTEIRQYGASSVQVVEGLRSMLDDLLTVAPDDRHAAIRRERDALAAATRA